MPIDPDNLLAWPFPVIEQTYTERDAMLYALGIGFSSDPLDVNELAYTYEDGLRIAPSLCVVLGTPGFWIKDPATGITWQKVLHGEQSFVLHQPLSPSATVVAINRVRDLIDKGEGKGALIYVERAIRDKASGQPLATLNSTYFCRADGGFGRSTCAQPQPPVFPERACDQMVELTIDKRAGLLYRLSGDYNPIHADPRAASIAGFKAPLFHGLGLFGVATHAVLRAACHYDSTALRSLSVRFTAPVFPGETLRFSLWQEGRSVFFRSTVTGRDVVALDGGIATLNEQHVNTI